MKQLFVILFLFLNVTCWGQSNLLQSGPMVGYSEMREVLLWVQTKSSAKVKFGYWEKGSPNKKNFTEEFSTQKDQAYTARLIADMVEPGKKYEYELYINNQKVTRPYPLEFQTQTIWAFRTEPPNFKFAAGSCFYANDEPYDRPGKPYGGGYEIFKKI